MDKYKINFIFGDENINDIFVNTLICELEKYIMMICKEKENELSLPCTYLSLEGGKDC